MRPSTLRAALLRLTPPIPKKVWSLLIRVLRARKKASGGEPRMLTGLAELNRALERPLKDEATPDEVQALHGALRALHGADPEDPAAQARAAQVDAAFDALSLRVRSQAVGVKVGGWHPSIPEGVRTAVLGPWAVARLAPVEAAVLRHELDGLVLGGMALTVRLDLGADEVLPAVPRSRRGGPLRRDREGSWLPYVDEEGRWSATPKDIAKRQAALLVHAGAREVLDPMCGCGADAIAFAKAGLRVRAIDRDAGRVQRTGWNAAELGVEGAIAAEQGDGLDALLELGDGGGLALYLDPPWGSAEAGDLEQRVGLDWAGLFGERSAEVADAVQRWAGPVLLKLPRAFDLATLPARPWAFHWMLGAREQGAERIVKVISALG